MKKILSLAPVAAFMMAGAPAFAQNSGPEAGDIQIKVMGSFVLPDGDLRSASGTLASSLPTGFDTKADDNFVPTLAAEYYFSPNFSVETICCVTQHDVNATAPSSLKGAEIVSNAKLIPATFTAKYHFNMGEFSPYVGAGPTYFLFFDDKPGSTSSTLGIDKVRVDDAFGLALQAGFDVPVSSKGVSLSVDAKRYFVKTDAHYFNSTGTEVLKSRHRLDPWVISAGVGFRF